MTEPLKLMVCRFCSSKPTIVRSAPDVLWVNCSDVTCDDHGPVASTERGAADKWNARAKRCIVADRHRQLTEPDALAVELSGANEGLDAAIARAEKAERESERVTALLQRWRDVSLSRPHDVTYERFANELEEALNG